MAKKLTDFQKLRLRFWAEELEELQQAIGKSKKGSLKRVQLIDEWEKLGEKFQKLDPAFSNPMTRTQLRQLIDKRFSQALSIKPGSGQKGKKEEIRKRNLLSSIDVANEIYHSDISDQEAEERIKNIFLHVNPRQRRGFISEIASGVAFGIGSGISDRFIIARRKNPMESFSSALKRNIRDYGFKKAMGLTWKEVKAGNVSPPPKKAVKSAWVKRRKSRKNPRRKWYVVEFPNGQTSQTFSTKKAAENFNRRFGSMGKVITSTPYLKGKNPHKKRSRKNPLAWWVIFRADGGPYVAKRGEPTALERYAGPFKTKKEAWNYIYQGGKPQRRNPQRKQSKKNPIAIYNPSKQTLLYGRAFIPEIRGIKTNGTHKGQRFRHRFENEVQVYGNPDGSLTVKGKNGTKLWDYEQNI